MNRFKAVWRAVPVLLFLALVLSPLNAYAEGQKETGQSTAGGQKEQSTAGSPGPSELEIVDTGMHAVISVPATNTGTRARLDRTVAQTVKAPAGIQPVADIRIYRVSRTAAGETLEEWNDFGKDFLLITLFQPASGLAPYFLVDKKNVVWLRYDQTADLQNAGFYLTGAFDGTINAYVLRVTSWPKGDPTYGWGGN